MLRSTTLLTAFLPIALSAQTLFTETFEGTPAFTLNTTDAGSSISAWNTWVINNSYTGGDGDVECLGFPFSYTIVNTPGQPVGISSQNGHYLHTASVEGIADGITCCSFGAADGFCIPADNTFSRMSGDVSTIGYSDVEFSFWWICAGAGNIYGQVYYSINGGGSWNLISAPIANYHNQSSWVQQTLTDPAFGNQATLRFGFKFVNNVALSAQDPGFGIDDVTITAVNGQQNAIAAVVQGQAFCQGSTLSVPYTILGTFNAGNVFTAQLSDASGSFASPVGIGSLMSVSGGSISCTIPPGATPGTGYRIRVVGSSPVTTGTDNGADITINDAPFAGNDGTLTLCGSAPAASIDLGGDAGGTWSGPSVVTNNLYDPGTMDPGTYTYTVHGTAPCISDEATMIVTESPGANAGNNAVAVICKSTGLYQLFDFLTGNPDAGGTWTDPGGNGFSGTFNSNNGVEGIYTYTVPAAGGCPSDDAVVSVQLGEPGNAGADHSWQVCSTNLPINLFGLLTNANLTGIWFENGVPFNGTTNHGGAFTYIDYAQVPCSNDTAQITLAVMIQPYAGQNGTVTICANGAPEALFPHIGGTPEPGGLWTDPFGSPFPGTFDPATDPAGLYTYTVPALAPCVPDDAVLAVIIDPCLGILENSGSAPGISWLGEESGTWLFRTSAFTSAELTVIDASGRCVLQQAHLSSTGPLRLDAASLAHGLYTLRLVSGNGASSVRFVR